jgi:hypothetical protein
VLGGEPCQGLAAEVGEFAPNLYTAFQVVKIILTR